MNDSLNISRYGNSMNVCAMGDEPRHVWLWIQGLIDLSISMTSAEMRQLGTLLIAQANKAEGLSGWTAIDTTTEEEPA